VIWILLIAWLATCAVAMALFVLSFNRPHLTKWFVVSMVLFGVGLVGLNTYAAVMRS
jgi:hypothetical protein